MKANKNKSVGLIIFNYFHFFFDKKASDWKNRGYPNLFFSNNIHPYNRATIFHEWLHVLGVAEGKSHNNLTFQQMASDPVYSCTNLAFPDNRTPSFKDFSLKDNKNYSITPASCLNCLTKAISAVIPQEESIQFCNTYRN